MNSTTPNFNIPPVASPFEAGKDLNKFAAIQEVGNVAVNANIDPASLGGISAFQKDIVSFKEVSLFNERKAAEARQAATDAFIAHELLTSEEKEKKDSGDYMLAA